MPTGTRTPGLLAREIAGILRAEMARQQRHQAEISLLTGISPGQVSKLFAGKKSFDIEDLDKIAHVLGLNVTKDVIDPASSKTQGRYHPVD